MNRIYWTGTFAASHKLKLPYKSPCTNTHGHNYKVEIWIESNNLTKTGMVMDYAKVKSIVMRFDHQDLNDFFTQPTAEHIAKEIHSNLMKTVECNATTNITVRVWETLNSYAEVP